MTRVELWLQMWHRPVLSQLRATGAPFAGYWLKGGRL